MSISKISALLPLYTTVHVFSLSLCLSASDSLHLRLFFPLKRSLCQTTEDQPTSRTDMQSLQRSQTDKRIRSPFVLKVERQRETNRQTDRQTTGQEADRQTDRNEVGRLKVKEKVQKHLYIRPPTATDPRR